MEDERMVRVTRQRLVIAFVEFWRTSWSLLEQGRSHPEGAFHLCMASMVFTAFAFEAYLNHVGSDVLSQKLWKVVERRPPKEKLEIIAEELGVTLDFGRRPWGILKSLFDFRNDIAHGKTMPLKDVKEVPLNKYHKLYGTLLETPWEKLSTQSDAERAREDVEAMVVALHQAWRPDDHYSFPCFGGEEWVMAELIVEPSPPDRVEGPSTSPG